LGWQPNMPLEVGITETFAWINNIVNKNY
jgi:hypothetical protein